MKRKIIYYASAGVVLLAVLFFVFKSCKRSREIDPAFREYIAAFTSGRISAYSTIRIEFVKETSGVELNTPVDEKLFSFSPSIDGAAYWIDSRTIEFRPEKPLKHGKTYTAKFALHKLFKVPRNLKTFEFDFETIEQAVSVEVDGYQPYSLTDLKWNNVSGKLLTADRADELAVEQMVEATQEGRKLSISWIHAGENNEHQFKIDSVQRGEEASEVWIKWDGDKIGAKNSDKMMVKIPSIYDFFAIDAKVVQEPDQYVSIRFSDPIDSKQDLKGLIHMDGCDFTFEVNGVEVKAFPATRQSGSTTLHVEQGIKNVAGAKMKESQTFQITFESIKPAVRLKGKGVILPDSKGLVLPFEAVNLKAVDLRIIKIYESNVTQFLQVNQLDGNYELKRAGRLIVKKTIRLGADKPIVYNKWNTFSIDLSGLIKQEPGAIYRVEFSIKKKYSTYPCDGGEEEEEDNMTTFQDLDNEDLEKEQSAWDYSDSYYYGDDYYGYGYDYDWEMRDDPCSPSYYIDNDRRVTRNIIASNLGIIAKGNSNNNYTFAVCDLLTTKPISGTTIEVYDYQKQVIGTATTDGDGFCTVTTKHKPFLIVAKNEEQRGYLRIDDGSALSLSSFDISGEVVQKGLKGFIYGERGVWRPGDTVYLTFVLEDKLKKIPANHPVNLEIINPQGRLFKKITKTSGENGFYLFSFKTGENDPTGNWQANIRVGSVVFTKTLKIETVKPNRLKILFNFDNEVLTADNQRADLNVKWLHGAPARNMKTNIKVTLSSASTAFKGFDGYVFADPSKKFETEEQTVFDGSIDNDGSASVDAGISVGNSAPGMLRANFVTRVFEPGGDFSIDKYTVSYSPYKTYVGLKCPEGNYGYLYTDTAQIFDVVTVNANGKPVNAQNLEFKIYKLEWRWWWNSDEDEVANYMSSTYHSPVFSKVVSTVNGKAKVQYRLNYPEWGRYLVVVSDPKSGHSTGNVVYFDWPLWRGRSDRGDASGATMLTFSSDKKSYKVGEKATLIVPTAPNSRLLVSLETGSEILKAWWETSTGNETRVTIDVTDKMAPNVYVHISLIQPHGQVQNDLPLRLYGVIPLKVDNPELHLQPVITMTDVMEPEKETVIKVNEKSNKPMTYTLAVVDEGLLDLTRFKTPDPWTAFNGREALGIKTWDMYDLVMGAYSGKIEQLFTIGGDGEADKSGSKAQRFKPIVKVLGPFTLKSGSNTHKIKLPQYIGSVRVMVVAGSNGAFGSAEKAVPVRKPLMVLATLPRVVGPGEEVDLPVTIFAMEKSIKNFKVEVSPNSMFHVIDSKSKQVQVNEIGEYDLSFRLKVASNTGIGKVKIIAQSGYLKSEYDVEIDVRNPNPKITKYFETTVEVGSSTDIDYEMIGIPGTNKAILEVSSIPPIDLSRRLGYLLSYPYGCAEQTTSGAFPQLYLDKFVELDADARKQRDNNMIAAIKRINSMMLSDGGIGYWPGTSYVNPWATCYAGHFMIEAEKHGFTLPSGFTNSWLRYQKREARSWAHNASAPLWERQHEELTQAYRLYTLALAGDPETGAMNRMKEIRGLSVSAAWRLAAAYALIGQNGVAKQIITSAGNEIKDYQAFNPTFGSVERDWAMMLETLSLLKDKTAAYSWMKKVANALSKDAWMSTQSTAYCLIGISKFLEMSGNTSSEVRYNYSNTNAKGVNVSTRLPVSKIDMGAKTIGNYKVKINNTGKGVLFARVVTEGIPETGPQEGFENNMSMSIDFLNGDGGNIDVTQLEQGTDFMAVVTIRNAYASQMMTNVALSQIFPSGWEISNTRLFQDGITEEDNSAYTYQDVRDDRVLTFFDLPIAGAKVFVVKLTATYCGKFYLPGTLCEAMYEPGVNAFIPGKWVEVVK